MVLAIDSVVKQYIVIGLGKEQESKGVTCSDFTVSRGYKSHIAMTRQAHKRGWGAVKD
jgi:hypothetical protein